MSDITPYLSWDEFKDLAEAGGLSAGIIESHVKVDEDKSQPFNTTLLFHPDDAMYADDVGSDEIFEILERDEDQKEQTYKRTSSRARGMAIKIAVMGDSWFHLPPAIRPVDITDVLRRMFDVNSTAMWGDELAKMVQRKQYLQVLKGGQRRHFLVSGGGNDVIVDIAKYVEPFRPGKDRESDAAFYIKPNFTDRVKDLIGLFAEIVNDIDIISKDENDKKIIDIKMYVHGYANVIPIPHGPYVGSRLEEIGFSPAAHPQLTSAIVARLLWIFNAHLASFANTSDGKVIYLDLRRYMGPSDWYRDELHPNSGAATRLAGVFADRIRSENAKMGGATES